MDVVLSRRFLDGWFGNVVYAYNNARIDDNDGFGGDDYADFNQPVSILLFHRRQLGDERTLEVRCTLEMGDRATDRRLPHQ